MDKRCCLHVGEAKDLICKACPIRGSGWNVEVLNRRNRRRCNRCRGERLHYLLRDICLRSRVVGGSQNWHRLVCHANYWLRISWLFDTHGAYLWACSARSTLANKTWILRC